METTITRTVKGELMESIFNDCNSFSVRFFTAKDLESEKDYDPKKSYFYEIKIRHAEETDAEKLFDAETQTAREQESLQNFANRFNMKVHVRNYEDKRKKNTYFLEEGNETISPCLDYTGLNNFLLGYLRCSKLLID